MLIEKEKKVLLVDTSFAALPIYKFLVSSGFQVWVIGNREGDVLAKKAGDKWIKQDYSKVEKVESIIKSIGVDYLVPGCTDVSIQTCMELNASSNLMDSTSINSVLSNKSSFRRMCAKLDLPSPVIAELDDFPMPGQYICKPVDSYSGRGVTIFDGLSMDSVSEAVKAAEKESTSSKVIIESFIEGQLHSYSAFIENDEVVYFFIVKEGSSANPFAVDTSFLSNELPDVVSDLLKGCVESISRHLNLKDGLLHTQFIYDGGKPVLVEMSRRCPGDLYPLLIEYSTGFNYAAKYASYFVSESINIDVTCDKPVLRHTLTSDEDLYFGALEFHDLQSIKAYYPLQKVGESIMSKQISRVGILFAEFTDRTDLFRGYEKFLAREAYIVN